MTTNVPPFRFGRIAGVVLALLVLLFAAAFCIALARVLGYAETDARGPADVILVLGAAVYPGERPSPALYVRTQTGVDLYRQGYAQHLVLSGGLGGYPPTEAEMMRRIAVGMGVSEEAILLEDQSHSTLANFENSARIMAERGWQSVLVVSDPYHIYRACRVGRDAGLVIYPVPAAASPTWTIPHLRAYYTLREVFAVMAYEIIRIWRQVF
jgi:uncharacterized SAM-binding protein YcdF (DUF218 family)